MQYFRSNAHPRPRYTLRARLGQLILACVLPAAALMVALLVSEWQAANERLRRDLVMTARAMAHSLDADLRGLEAGLKVLALTPSAVQGRWDEFRPLAEQARERLGVANVNVSDPHGQQLLNLRVPAGAALPEHGAKDQVRLVAATGMAATTNLFRGNVSGAHVANVLVPIERDGRVVAVLGGQLDEKWLGALGRRRTLPENWTVSVYDADLRIVGHSKGSSFIGERPLPETLQNIGALGAEGAFERTTVSGEEVLGAFSRVQHSGWVVNIGIPVAELQSELTADLALVGGAVVLLVAGSLLAARQFSRPLARSIEQLQASAEALGRGDALPASGPMYFEEADRLAQAFETAGRRIHDAHEALADSEARMRGILETAVSGVITVNEQLRVVMFNGAAERIFGYPRSEVIGQPLAMLMPERFRAGHDANVQRFAAEDRPREMAGGRVVYGLRSNGEEFPIEASTSSMRDARGRRFYTVILRDVTDRVRDREALVRSNVELQQFAFVASHDLRSPLRTIKGYLALLAMRYADAPPAALELITRANAATDQLDGLTADLLSFARLHSQARPFTDVSMNEVVRDALTQVQVPAQERQARISVGELPHLSGDRTQLIQVFQNLVGNALTYCERTPEIEIGARRQDGAWLFWVRDNGIGIEPQYREKIFEIFKRLHSAHEYPGTGIGLAVCQRIVQRHGGRIWVESTPGEGSTFFFTIPTRSPGDSS